MRIMAFPLLLAMAAGCSARTDDGAIFARERFSGSAAHERALMLADNPPDLSEDEIDAIRSRMRMREFERFPLEREEPPRF